MSHEAALDGRTGLASAKAIFTRSNCSAQPVCGEGLVWSDHRRATYPIDFPLVNRVKPAGAMAWKVHFLPKTRFYSGQVVKLAFTSWIAGFDMKMETPRHHNHPYMLGKINKFS